MNSYIGLAAAMLLSEKRPFGTARLAERVPPRKGPRVGRNDLCPCGRGKKYKNCCREKD